MPIYGWDCSHHDWARGPMDIAAAVADGIVFMTHKLGEGRSFVDERYDDFYRRARSAKVALLGAYYVNHPGDQVAQADRFLALLDARAPGWRDGPFVLQVDAEKFDYMDRAPNLAEIKAFCARIVGRTGGRFRPVVYAPRWLYGDNLAGLGYPLWASNYGSNPAVHYKAAYPGDGSSRWGAYSGQTPAILQYGSRTRIGTQPTCDANAYRGTLAQLRNLVYPLAALEDIMATLTDAEKTELLSFVRYGDPRIEALMQGLDVIRFGPEGIEERQRRGLPPVPVWPVAQIKALVAGQKAIVAAMAGDQDAERILARIDALAVAEAQRDVDAAARDAAILALLEQHADGSLDAAAVVEQIRALVHAATAPTPAGRD